MCHVLSLYVPSVIVMIRICLSNRIPQYSLIPNEGFFNIIGKRIYVIWPAPGSADTELGVLMEPEVGHGETEVYARVQA